MARDSNLEFFHENSSHKDGSQLGEGSCLRSRLRSQLSRQTAATSQASKVAKTDHWIERAQARGDPCCNCAMENYSRPNSPAVP